MLMLGGERVRRRGMGGVGGEGLGGLFLGGAF